MNRRFHYAKNGNQFGPVPEEEILRLLGSGALGAADLVWTDGMASWTPIAVSEFARRIPVGPGTASNLYPGGPPAGSSSTPVGAIIAGCVGAVLVIFLIGAWSGHLRQQEDASIQPGSPAAVSPSPSATPVEQEVRQPDPTAQRLAEEQAALLQERREREEQAERERQERLARQQEAAQELEQEQSAIRGTYVGMVNGQMAMATVHTRSDGSILVANPFNGGSLVLSRNGRGDYSGQGTQCEFGNGSMTLSAGWGSAVFVKN